MSAHTSVLCAIPGLVWPAPGLHEILSSLDLPGLSTLLARAEVQHATHISFDAWLAAEFGQPVSPPFAAIRLAGEMGTAPDAGSLWVCADPVNLRFARQSLLLDGPAALDLQAHEMTSLFDDLNKSFGDAGKFVCTSRCGYLALDAAHADKLATTLSPLCDVENRPVTHFQPQGKHADWWSRLSNELQVFCHNHAVNAAREARGAPGLNALWLWGAGMAPATLAAPAARLAAHLVNPQPLLAGLARLAQTKLEVFEPQHAAEWLVVDALFEPAQQRDAARWAQALQTLDAEVLVPLAKQLRERKIARLTIISPGDSTLARFDISPPPRWQIWQNRASKARLLAALGYPA
ncbi:MAG: hypothetical protein JWL63_2528 [Rhodocyclales bacterium]|nr:hypothetical protein [Rhodocyclales bacterium]